MKTSPGEAALIDLLHTLQVNVLYAHQTQCSANWQGLDYTPTYNKLYFIQEGEGWLKIGEKEYFPQPGQLCLMPAHTTQSFSIIEDRQPFLKYWCHFSIKAGPLDLFQWIGVPFCIDVSDRQRMEHLFQQLMNPDGHSEIITQIRRNGIMLELLASYLEQVPVRMLQHRNEEINRLNVIQAYVDEHLHTSVSVEELAGIVHLHPNYFITFFKKHFGLSPLKYVNRKRADRAKLLLLTTSLSIKEIADRTGFDDTNHFTKFFRKDAGVSPTEFRATFS
ncbi:AraC family transcriptional regulator [Paenibacillus sp. J5C_2022]|uniref:AraC family transcriptional regulator n=1 Tax=Paenibacillus sp. J5C2022 TaxID=2977129 RepID=UPI0021CECAF6|nr:AraC family transcriptional regulator [Paenibacillus sp. J5C2022]MCU6712060.1 AraC family transcriptional regulator [Paenibacillus sp. J5C2022]